MAFSKDNLKKTKIWCEQVIRLIDEVEKERQQGFVSLFGPEEKNHEYYTAPPSKKTGELRRRSMDLTRQLAQLRK